MKFTSTALSGWYIPDVGDNRTTKEFRVKLSGATTAEYRGAVRAGMAKATKAKLEDLAESADESLIRSNVTEVIGLEYTNSSGAPLKIGSRTVQPSEALDVKDGAELVDAMRSAGDAQMAIAILADIGNAIRDRSELERGLVPT